VRASIRVQLKISFSSDRQLDIAVWHLALFYESMRKYGRHPTMEEI
jgi:hypothetical protein